MEDKKQIKISLKTFIFILVMVIIIGVAIFFVVNKHSKLAEKSIFDTISIKTYENKNYYFRRI